ncbi:MAG: histidine phosphatase family protein [Bacteroidales bacterium]|jgi:phosphohistidine phosphatase|nr:histidine phosphatase family protein [Bacteroidales bacterium]
MKLLTLIRHAKSGMDNDLSDFDRPLNDKGNSDAEKMGEYLNANLPKPDLIISSPAVRAATTAEIIAEKTGYPEDKIKYVDELYLCSISEYIEVLIEQSVKTRHIFLISHNPGTTGFTNLLAGENIDNIPTCGVAHIELDLYKWEDVEPGTGKLVKFFTPKNI